MHFCCLQVSATFAASLVISPGLGAYLGSMYGEAVVVEIASAVALLDVLFILIAVPESLPERSLQATSITWEEADPFSVSFFIVQSKHVYIHLLDWKDSLQSENSININQTKTISVVFHCKEPSSHINS